MTERPGLKGVLETVLYCDSFDEDKVREFYVDVLGLQQMGDMHFAYRAGTKNHVFLLFNRDDSVFQEAPPPHGATGSIHVCFEAEEGAYDNWKEFFASKGVQMFQEMTWGNGQRSFYFNDPAGNLLEMAEGDFWPQS